MAFVIFLYIFAIIQGNCPNCFCWYCSIILVVKWYIRKSVYFDNSAGGKALFKKMICAVLSIAVLTATLTVSTSAAQPSGDRLLVTVSSDKKEPYKEYALKYKDINSAEVEIPLGEAKLEEGQSVEWLAQIPDDALYMIRVTYKTVDTANLQPLLELRIDGNVPFDEASSLGFSRLWKNETEIEQDKEGNDIYQSQIQLHESQTQYLLDTDGYYADPYSFYLTAGTHTFTIEAVQCGLDIESIVLCPVKKAVSYKEALKWYKAEGLSEIKGDYLLKIQAEDVSLKSDAMLAAVSDRSSPAVEPPVDKNTKLNILGGGRFSQSGQWIEYEIENIPSDGLYRLVFKVKQNECKGIDVTRAIYVNGEIPYAEAEGFKFSYSSKYKNITFGDGNDAYLIPLKKGKNTIRIKATLGETADLCYRVEQSLNLLNDAYHQLVTVTGTSPDIYRDYDIQQKMPEVVKLFGKQAKVLAKLADDIEKSFGKSSSFTAIIRSIVVQLERMYDDPYGIPSEVSALSSNLSSLGSVVSSMKKTDISLDYLLITASESKIPSAKAGFFDSVSFAVRHFIYSFVADYNSVGSASDSESSVTAWIISGRDQTQVLRQLIDSDFTPNSNVGVELRLVTDVTTLLQATLAGVGPDVAINIPQATVMNFAYRGAVADLSKFEQTESIRQRFTESTLNTITYNGALYGVPQTASFPVLFYRADILKELNVEVPETWDDIYRILPVLTQNNMSFGLQTSDITNGSTAGVTSYGMLLYQRGGAFYSEDGKTPLFDSDLAIETMRSWTDLYSGYGMPVSYNFANRFASGEMPLAVADYVTSFNTLVVFAPQIEGLWGMTLVPGTADENGDISHTVPVTVTAGIILESSKNKDGAIKFLDWWSSDKTQARFGSFLESLLGAAGRYAAANVNVIEQLSWSKLQYENIKAQLNETVGIPEVTGGYFTWRNLDNAFREIIDDGTDVREVMYSCNKAIREEMAYQRDALGLD